MWGQVIHAGIVIGLLAAASGSTLDGGDTRVKADLEAVGGRSVVFGHMSVGMNVLDGLQELASRHGVSLRIADVSQAPAAAPGTFSHLFLGANGDAPAKLESFSRALAALPAGEPAIALVKFCYVDFQADTDARALFERYRSTLAALQARHPQTRFVHVTAPLSTVQSGPKAWAKRALGKAPYGLAENARREEFNALLREAYLGREPVFDLARLESTLPDGGQATATWNGRTFPVLADAYTDDGGHLNAAGRARAARELAAVLAAAPGR